MRVMVYKLAKNVKTTVEVAHFAEFVRFCIRPSIGHLKLNHVCSDNHTSNPNKLKIGTANINALFAKFPGAVLLQFNVCIDIPYKSAIIGDTNRAISAIYPRYTVGIIWSFTLNESDVRIPATIQIIIIKTNDNPKRADDPIPEPVLLSVFVAPFAVAVEVPVAISKRNTMDFLS